MALSEERKTQREGSFQFPWSAAGAKLLVSVSARSHRPCSCHGDRAEPTVSWTKTPLCHFMNFPDRASRSSDLENKTLIARDGPISSEPLPALHYTGTLMSSPGFYRCRVSPGHRQGARDRDENNPCPLSSSTSLPHPQNVLQFEVGRAVPRQGGPSASPLAGRA